MPQLSTMPNVQVDDAPWYDKGRRLSSNWEANFDKLQALAAPRGARNHENRHRAVRDSLKGKVATNDHCHKVPLAFKTLKGGCDRTITPLHPAYDMYHNRSQRAAYVVPQEEPTDLGYFVPSDILSDSCSPLADDFPAQRYGTPATLYRSAPTPPRLRISVPRDPARPVVAVMSSAPTPTVPSPHSLSGSSDRALSRQRLDSYTGPPAPPSTPVAATHEGYPLNPFLIESASPLREAPAPCTPRKAVAAHPTSAGSGNSVGSPTPRRPQRAKKRTVDEVDVESPTKSKANLTDAPTTVIGRFSPAPKRLAKKRRTGDETLASVPVAPYRVPLQNFPAADLEGHSDDEFIAFAIEGSDVGGVALDEALARASALAKKDDKPFSLKDADGNVELTLKIPGLPSKTVSGGVSLSSLLRALSREAILTLVTKKCIAHCQEYRHCPGAPTPRYLVLNGLRLDAESDTWETDVSFRASPRK